MFFVKNGKGFEEGVEDFERKKDERRGWRGFLSGGGGGFGGKRDS